MSRQIDNIYVNYWGKQKPQFTEMELALMEGGHDITTPKEIKMEFIKSLRLNENKNAS